MRAALALSGESGSAVGSPAMVSVEWGHGPRQRSVREDELDELLDRISAEARRDGRPQDVQVTVAGAGTLGIVVGADWSVLNHIPAHLNPPYMVSVGQEQSDDPVAFYVAGDHHSEALGRNTIKTEAARAAMRHFVASGNLSPDVDWDEV
jgi:hypothetical protein